MKKILIFLALLIIFSSGYILAIKQYESKCLVQNINLYKSLELSAKENEGCSINNVKFTFNTALSDIK